jgi:hypothetical protein
MACDARRDSLAARAGAGAPVGEAPPALSRPSCASSAPEHRRP